MRRGRMPIEPSSTHMFWSSPTWGMEAASSKAPTAETSTASLVRTSSRHPPSSSSLSSVPDSRNASPSSTLSPVPLLAGRRLLEIGDQLGLAAAARHRIEHEARDDRKRRQQHQAGGENCRRNTRHDAQLEISHEDRNRQANGNDRERNAEPGEKSERPLRAVKTDDGGEDLQAIAPGAELRHRPLRARVVRRGDLGHR